jgi:hypothetical protein
MIKNCFTFESKVTNMVGSKLVMSSSWPFSTWGLYLVGPFKKARGGFIHIFIAVDKFTKWIEVKPAASITVAKAVEFIKGIKY